MLKSETNTPEVEAEIIELAGGKFGDGCDVFFEHGQWFVTVEPDEDDPDGQPKSYSVVTCSHGSGFGHTDIDFEEL